MNILDLPTLESALRTDLSDDFIRETIRVGQWCGMPVPGEPEWTENTTDEQGRPVLPSHRLYVLGLAQYTRRHPTSDQTAIAIAADVLHGQATGWSGPYPIEDDPRHDRATAWLLAIAGGHPAPPGNLGCMSVTPPLDRESGRALVPGGSERFTRFAVEFLDRLLFLAPEAAESFAQDYLALYQADPYARRAEIIFSRVKRWRYAPSAHDVRPASCHECGESNLQHWYTAKSSGYQLCQACFDTWVQAGRAREAEV